MKETVPFITTTKRIKYLGINLPKETKDLKDDTNRWRDVSRSWIGEINIVKTTILPKQSTDSMQSLSNYQSHFS